MNSGAFDVLIKILEILSTSEPNKGEVVTVHDNRLRQGNLGADRGGHLWSSLGTSGCDLA